MEAILAEEYTKVLEEHLRATHCGFNYLAKLSSIYDEVDFLEEAICINLYKEHDSILFFDDEFRRKFIEKNFGALLGKIEGDNELVILEKKCIKFIYLISNNQIALTFIDPWTYYDSIDWQSIKNRFQGIGLRSDILAKSEREYKKEFLADHIIFKCLELFPKERSIELLSSLCTLLKMAGLYSKMYSDLFETLGVGSQYCLTTGLELLEKGYFSEEKAHTAFIKPNGKAMFPKLLKLSNCKFSDLKDSVEDFRKAFKKFIDNVDKQKSFAPIRSTYKVSLDENIKKQFSNNKQVALLNLYGNVSDTGEIYNLSIIKDLIESWKEKPYSQITFICQENNIREIIQEAVREPKTKETYKELYEEELKEIYSYIPESELYHLPYLLLHFRRHIGAKRDFAKNLQKLIMQ